MRDEGRVPGQGTKKVGGRSEGNEGVRTTKVSPHTAVINREESSPGQTALERRRPQSASAIFHALRPPTVPCTRTAASPGSLVKCGRQAPSWSCASSWPHDAHAPPPQVPLFRTPFGSSTTGSTESLGRSLACLCSTCALPPLYFFRARATRTLPRADGSPSTGRTGRGIRFA